MTISSICNPTLISCHLRISPSINTCTADKEQKEDPHRQKSQFLLQCWPKKIPVLITYTHAGWPGWVGLSQTEWPGWIPGWLTHQLPSTRPTSPDRPAQLKKAYWWRIRSKFHLLVSTRHDILLIYGENIVEHVKTGFYIYLFNISRNVTNAREIARPKTKEKFKDWIKFREYGHTG